MREVVPIPIIYDHTVIGIWSITRQKLLAWYPDEEDTASAPIINYLMFHDSLG